MNKILKKSVKAIAIVAVSIVAIKNAKSSNGQNIESVGADNILKNSRYRALSISPEPEIKKVVRKALIEKVSKDKNLLRQILEIQFNNKKATADIERVNSMKIIIRFCEQKSLEKQLLISKIKNNLNKLAEFVVEQERKINLSQVNKEEKYKAVHAMRTDFTIKAWEDIEKIIKENMTTERDLDNFKEAEIERHTMRIKQALKEKQNVMIEYASAITGYNPEKHLYLAEYMIRQIVGTYITGICEDEKWLDPELPNHIVEVAELGLERIKEVVAKKLADIKEEVHNFNE